MSAVATVPKIKQDIYVSRISKVVDEWMAKDEDYRERLDRRKTIKHLTTLMKKFSLDEFLAIEDEDFKQRIKKLMTNQLVGGMLSDLNPEEMRIFNEAIARR